MKIKINEKILSLPPYISTSWKNIISLQIDNRFGSPVLIIELISGSRIEVPHLDSHVIDHIFSVHALSLENPDSKKIGEAVSFTLPFNLLAGGLLPGIEGMSALLQHNLEQASTPDLPKELLDKMVDTAKNIGIDDVSSLPKAEPHCNCPHCQIMRAFHASSDKASSEEEVSEEDLKFRSWDVKQNGDQLYTVTNPLATDEHYSVFLGDPIGCTCGQKNCEHIQAVLHT